ncbi:MAG: hypothetical protein E6R03_18330 [Hyphomicrobiaceae bacterium]|nr:MAG: hypothetical protein E6R03_18330 [Hyphomicrobiaceae bacterium]
MTVELDEKALEAAAKAHYESELFSYGWSDVVDSHKKLSALRAAITAYLAARPTPDAAAMEREEQAFRIELDRFALCAEKASIWYPTDEYHTNRVSKRNNRREELIDIYRKAASR